MSVKILWREFSGARQEMSPDGTSFTYVRVHNSFKGWLRDDLPADAVARIVGNFDGWMQRSSARLLKNDGKSQVVQQVFEDGTGKRWDIVFKRVTYSFTLRRLGFLVFASPAIRSFRGALLLQEKGISTAAPLAAVEPRSWPGLGTSYYFAETVDDGRTLYVLLEELQKKCRSGMSTLERRRFLRDLSAFFCRVHSSGIYHRDLKGSNILARNGNGENFEFVLIDLDGVRRSRIFSWRKRINNLVQICRSRHLSYRDKVFFLVNYSRRCGISKRKMKSLTRRVVALTTPRRANASPAIN